MVDYRVHLAALDAFREQLALTDFAEPDIANLRDGHVADADAEPAAATLGALIDHLFWHASSDSSELDLLGRAAELWSRGRGVYKGIADFRDGLESALADPSDAGALAQLNSASSRIRSLAQDVRGLSDEVQALRKDVALHEHPRPHPRQDDRRLGEWGWSDAFLARRTEAFVREVRARADDLHDDHPRASAFAFGALASYGANAAGSAYLTQVVGGPRRGHRHRDRLARNTVGSWVAEHDPAAATLADVRQRLEQAFTAELPATLVSLVDDAVGATYDLGRMPPTPDLQLGYRRLLQHLTLLDAFEFPPDPELPREPFLSRLFGDPASGYQPSMPEGTGLVEAGQPPGQGPSAGAVMPQSNSTQDDGPNHAEPADSTEVKCGAFWEAIGSAFLFLIGGWFACVIRWADGDRCELWDNITQNWEEAFPGGAVVTVGSAEQPLTAEQVGNVAQSDQIAQFVGDLHNLQSLMWEGFHKAREFLAVYGLIYPDGYLGRWRYRQYLSVPDVERGDWPKLPEPGALFYEYPATGVEQPASFNTAYQPGVTPAAVIARVPQSGTTSAADVALVVWEQMARGVLDSSNLDLDADRDWRHPCWQAAGSISDQPIDVVALSYDET